MPILAKKMNEVAEQTVEVKEGDRRVETAVKFRSTLKRDTGYPRNLTETEIVRMIYFFGGRKYITKSSPQRVSRAKATVEEQLSKIERIAVDDFFRLLGFTYNDKQSFSTAYVALTQVFREIILFLRKKPAFITRPIYEACKLCGYESVYRHVVMVVDKQGNMLPRLAIPDHRQREVPIGNMENMLWEIQNITLDKMMYIAQSISPADIKHANLGMKSKAFRDLFSAFHMARLQQKNPNLTLVNVNVHGADGGEKMKALASYVQKNRES